ncbi:MAG: 2-succinyl-6-hydroxy-2,4-cyclohexadiene-1-carboxylate synthase [Solirubrobacteraceae bacterium]
MARELVLLHGFTHTGASWEGVTSALGERYRAIAPDIRGHGRAADRIPVTLEAVTEDVAQLAPVRFTLAGYSMGGRLALHVALALGRPRVQRLVLIGASPGLGEPRERQARREADERLATELEGLSIEAFVERWSQTPVLAGQPPALKARIDADRLRNSTAGLALALRGLGTGALPSLWGKLRALEMPVVLVAGERDEKFTRLAEQMAAQIGGAEVVIVPGAGHAVHLEAPARVAEIIAEVPVVAAGSARTGEPDQ